MNFTMIIIASVVAVALIGGGYWWLSSTLAAKDKIITAQQITLAARQIDIDRLTTSNTSLSQLVEQREKDLAQSQALLENLRKSDTVALEVVKAITEFTRNPSDLDKANKYLECRNNNFPDIEKCLEFLK